MRFPADSQLPDPYDGLIAAHTDKLKVHACIGLPLLDKEQLIGALTIDGLDPCQFDDFSDEELRSLSAIAAASLGNACCWISWKACRYRARVDRCRKPATVNFWGKARRCWR